MRTRVTLVLSALMLLASVAVPALRAVLHDDVAAARVGSLPASSAADDADDADDERHGPPAWARSGGTTKAIRGASTAWKQRTPEERRDLMARLVEQHRAGMQAFGRCVDAGRDDCEKPLPPGLAKKL